MSKLTVAEATRMWCPFSERIASKCEAGDCMAWAWTGDYIMPLKIHVEDHRDYELTIEPVRPAKVPASYIWTPYHVSMGNTYYAGWTEPDSEKGVRKQGYCQRLKSLTKGW
jgi:hypothetical protein